MLYVKPLLGRVEHTFDAGFKVIVAFAPAGTVPPVGLGVVHGSLAFTTISTLLTCQLTGTLLPLLSRVMVRGCNDVPLHVCLF